MEQQRRLAEDPLRKLLGVGSQDLNQDMLTRYNVNTLQVNFLSLNDFLQIGRKVKLDIRVLGDSERLPGED